MLVEIAEMGALPAAKSVIGERHGDRHIDADHADIDARGEIAGRVAIAGKESNAIAVFMGRGVCRRSSRIPASSAAVGHWPSASPLIIASSRFCARVDEHDGADILTTPEFDWIGGKRRDAS